MSEKKEEIKQNAIDLFYKKGYFATSIGDIARPTGIRKSSIYYHYQNKEEILFDILKTTMLDLDRSLEEHIEGVDDPEQKMRSAITSHIIFHIERQKEVIISDSELRGLSLENYKAITKMRDEYEHKFQALIKNGIEKQVFVDYDFKIISYGILTMCTAVALWFRPKGRLTKREIAEMYTDFIVDGLKKKHYRQRSGPPKKGRG